jgi:hypothetical protein
VRGQTKRYCLEEKGEALIERQRERGRERESEEGGEMTTQADDDETISRTQGPFGDYVLPSLAIGSIAMTIGGFSYGLKRQKRKLLEDSNDTMNKKQQPNLSRRRQQMEEISSKKSVKIEARERRSGRKRIRAPRPPPRSLSFNPTQSALKALAYGSIVAWSGALFLAAGTAWYLDVKTFSEFGDMMRFKSKGLAPYLRNTLSLRNNDKKIENGDSSSDRDLSSILLEAERKESSSTTAK